MIDKYTIFNDITLKDFYYIIHILQDKKAIQILDKDVLYTELLQVLEEYKDEDEI